MARTPWEGIDGYPVEFFNSDPPDVLPAPEGTIYYPGFGWVMSPIKPGYPYWIIPEGKDGYPVWEDMYDWVYEPDDFIDGPVEDLPGLWGVTDDGYLWYNIPGYGQWIPEPDGRGGTFFGEDGRNWEWVPPDGIFGDYDAPLPRGWKWQELGGSLDEFGMPIARSGLVVLNTGAWARSMNIIQSGTKSTNNLGGPFSIDGYFPLYKTPTAAISASPTAGYHTHNLRGVVYYMPNGLEMNVTQFHGNYGSNNRQFSLKDSSGNFSKYSKGEVVLYLGELYEVLFDTFAKFPTDQKFFRLLTEKTDVSSIVDGGEF